MYFITGLVFDSGLFVDEQLMYKMEPYILKVINKLF